MPRETDNPLGRDSLLLYLRPINCRTDYSMISPRSLVGTPKVITVGLVYLGIFPRPLVARCEMRTPSLLISHGWIFIHLVSLFGGGACTDSPMADGAAPPQSKLVVAGPVCIIDRARPASQSLN